ncbi:MAG: nagJ [bacterium]|nr:nagJ [bacterium]
MRIVVSIVALISLAACTDHPRPMSAVLTTPRYLVRQSGTAWTSRACIDTSALQAHERLDALVGDVFAEAGLRRPAVSDAAGCQWMLRVSNESPSLSGDAQSVWDAGSAEPERFTVTSAVEPTQTVATTIFAATERGALFGLRSALQFFVERYTSDGQQVLEGTLVDYPAFSRRGIIEGFYGATFSSNARSKLIELSACLRQNTYIYALKDADPFTHARWRDPYDGTWAPIISKAVSVANRNLIDFVWAVSPGYFGGPIFQSRSIHYGSDDDFQRLVAKTEDLRALGVDRFALFVDDVAPDFAWPDDAARFSSLAAAHAYLMNRWDDYLMATGAPQHLWVVGTKYTSDSSNYLSGAGWADYNRTLAAALHPEIQMFWTGPQIYSERIAPDDLKPIEDLVQRRVLLWDNWPKLPDALRGRAPDLDERAAGLLSNFVMDSDVRPPSAAMKDFEQALGTIADYAWQPEGYEPSESLARWTSALDQQLGRLP